MPLLQLRAHASDKFVKAPVEQWLGALLWAVADRDGDAAPGLRVMTPEQPTPAICFELGPGGHATRPPATWLLIVLRRLSAIERINAVAFTQKHAVIRTAGASPISSVGNHGHDPRALRVLLGADSQPVAAMLEEWVAAILHALPPEVRERAFRAVRQVVADTPGHRRLHAEMPETLGAS